jgi:hypothetical protein
MKSSRSIIIAALLILSTPALPTNTKPPADPAAQVPQPVSAAATADAHASAAAQSAAAARAQQAQQQVLRASTANTLAASGGAGGGGGAGGDSASSSSAEGGSASGVGDVDVGGDVTRYRSTAIALAVPGATAAPAVPGECLRHTRGWSAGMGAAAASGGTKFDERQCDRVHCLAIADRYAHAGLMQAMADQLATCGGVHGVRVVVPPAAAASPAARVTNEPAVKPADLDALEQRLMDRMDRQFIRSLGK